MHIQTKFLKLSKPVLLGDPIGDWRVCWLGGWDKGRAFFVVMVCQLHRTPLVWAPGSQLNLLTVASSMGGHQLS